MSKISMGINSININENNSIGPVLTGNSDAGIRRITKGITIEQAKNTIPGSLACLSVGVLSGFTDSISTTLTIVFPVLILRN